MAQGPTVEKEPESETLQVAEVCGGPLEQRRHSTAERTTPAAASCRQYAIELGSLPQFPPGAQRSGPLAVPHTSSGS